MLNERDENQYEGDDTEYHFSDEEINYDVDASAEPKVAPVESTGGGSAALSGILQKKRMIISAVVFIVLVGVVYKVVSPTGSSAPETQISAIQSVPSVPAIAQSSAPKAASQPAPAFNARATTKPAAPAPAPSMAVKQDTQTVQMPGQTAAPKPLPQASAPSQATAVQASPAVPTTTPTFEQQLQQQQQAQAAPAPAYSQMVGQQQPQQRNTPTTYPQPTAQLPSLMGSGPAMPTQTASSVASTLPTIQVPGSQEVNSKVASLAAQNERLMEQLQTQYDQRIKDYQSQNQNLQQQVQTLSSRVAGMESELNKVLQNITAKQQSQAAPASRERAMPVEPRQPEAKAPNIPYHVQAIIPGRAWLKSKNGETITVSEGDPIKSVGRVTKIDPYDGIVEINTGRRVVALSYSMNG